MLKLKISIDLVPARFSVAIMLFFACWVNYMMRVNMSVNIIAMVPDDAKTTSLVSFLFDSTKKFIRKINIYRLYAFKTTRIYCLRFF